MYLITVRTNGVAEQKEIPSSWNDLKWSDYVKAVQANKDDAQTIRTISALTGIPQATIDSMCSEHQRFLLSACSFFWNENPPMLPIPFEVAEKSIDKGTWEQLIDCETEFKRINDIELPQIAAAQLIIRTYTGLDISTMTVPEALGYWDFFFGFSLSGRSDGRTSTTTSQMTMRSRQVLRRFKYSDGSRPFTPLQMVIPSSITQYYRQRPIPFTARYFTSAPNASTRRLTDAIRNLRTGLRKANDPPTDT